MSNVTPIRPNRIDVEEAGRWIARIDRGLSREEHDALGEWLRHPHCRELLFRFAQDWDNMAVVSELADMFPLPANAKPWWRVAGQAAAVLLLVGALGGFAWYGYPRLVPLRAVTATVQSVPREAAAASGFRALYSTAIGELRTVELPDHSRLRLNTDTEVRVDFSATGRLLTMGRGEAMFEVAKDPDRVFSVHIAGYEFKAVGTAFNIRADSPGGLRLTVTEGRVRVHQDQGANSPDNGPNGVAAAPVFESAHDQIVAANKSISISRQGERIETLTPDQVAAATAWQHGAIVFKSTPLSQVVNELSRYSTERFVIAKPELANIPVSGYFAVGDIDNLAAALQQNIHITVTRHDGYLLLSDGLPLAGQESR